MWKNSPPLPFFTLSMVFLPPLPPPYNFALPPPGLSVRTAETTTSLDSTPDITGSESIANTTSYHEPIRFSMVHYIIIGFAVVLCGLVLSVPAQIGCVLERCRALKMDEKQ